MRLQYARTRELLINCTIIGRSLERNDSHVPLSMVAAWHHSSGIRVGALTQGAR